MAGTMPGCAHCGQRLEVVGNQVGRRDVCPHCEEELHSCRNCRHFDLHVARQCKEPFSEPPSDKDGANFCEYFQIGEGGLHARQQLQDALSAAEALFKKG